MDDAGIRQRLTERDAAGVPELKLVDRLMGFRGGGMFHSYNVRVIGEETPYIAKLPSHEQPPAHSLLLELAVARLAHLFNPPLAPAYAVLDLRAEHVAGVVCGGCQRALEPTQAFGSRQVADVVEFRGGAPPAIDPEQAARVVAFQTWMEAGDAQMVISVDGSGLSMDHAHYLRGAHSWNPTAAQMVVDPVCIPGLDASRRLADRRLFDAFLEQLTLINDEQIVDAFGGIPQGWWAPFETRARLATYALARRPLVEAAVESFWR